MVLGIFGEIAKGVIEWSQSIVSTFGYLGVFLASFVGSATVILPAPVFLAIFAAGSVLNPWLVGIIGGLGAALGELTGYIVGRGGKKVIEKKHKKWIDRTKSWFEKHGAFPIITLFAATPLPDDVVGILCGVINYDLKKFFLATLIGKIAMMTALAWGGALGIQAVLQFFGG